MPVFYLHDTRVSGATPRCVLPVQANPGDNIGEVVRRLALRIQADFGGTTATNVLRILAHCTPNGIQLGAPSVTQDNVLGFFAPPSGKVNQIELRCCAAALIYNRGNPTAGTYDGELLCRRLATTASAFVVASDTTQFYIPSESIVNTTGTSQIWSWQGNVGTWNPQGRLVGMSTQAQRDVARDLRY